MGRICLFCRIRISGTAEYWISSFSGYHNEKANWILITKITYRLKNICSSFYYPSLVILCFCILSNKNFFLIKCLSRISIIGSIVSDIQSSPTVSCWETHLSSLVVNSVLVPFHLYSQPENKQNFRPIFSSFFVT